jgi:hypothetical protein
VQRSFVAKSAPQDDSGSELARARRRYQVTIAASEKTKMMVEMALISGVMPRRRRPQISSGRVLSRSDQEKADSDFVHGESEDQQSCADDREPQVGKSHPPESLPVVCAQVERCFFLRAVEFLQTGEDFGRRN